MNQIYQQHWISLPKEVRNFLVETFAIPRTGVTEVIDQTVKSDGYSNDDLKAITLEKMTAFVGSEETFMRAWELTLMKVHSELNPPVGIVGEDAAGVVRGTGSVVLNEQTIEDKLIEENIKNIVEEPVKPPFCDTCDSKGVRHKKDCPKFISPQTY